MEKSKISLLILATFFSILSINPNAYALSDSQEELIADKCSVIKNSLKSTQHSDAYSRIYLGSIYEEIINNYMSPFNNRLIKTEQINESLSQIQEEFTEQRSRFNSDFIIYSKSLENLLNIDCKNYPKDFYNQLEVTRKDRNQINTDVEMMMKIIEKYRTAILKFEDSNEKIQQ